MPGRGILAAYSPRFWEIVVTTGIVAGIGASALVELLRLVERVSYGRRTTSLLLAVRAAPAWRHLVVLALAAVIVIVGLRVLGHLPVSGGTEVSEAIWLRDGGLAWWGSVARAILSIVTVGMGVSLGREGAPQLVGAATASGLADRARLPVGERRLLTAAGAGAAFAAVYNVPLGGTFFALEVLLGTLSLPLVLPALLCSAIATAVGWILLGTGPLYHVPAYAFHPSQLVFAVVLGPFIGLLAVGWVRLIGLANRLRPTSQNRIRRYATPLVVFLCLAAVSIPYPQILGNGRDIVQLAVIDRLSLGLLAILLVLKPLATAACLNSGSPGGLFTPSFAIGVIFAGFCGTVFSHIWPGVPVGSLALIGGGAFLAASMQGPLSGTVLVLELTRHFEPLVVPTLLAVVEATVLARLLGARSIYSARLGHEPTGPPAGRRARPAEDALHESAG